MHYVDDAGLYLVLVSFAPGVHGCSRGCVATDLCWTGGGDGGRGSRPFLFSNKNSQIVAYYLPIGLQGQPRTVQLVQPLPREAENPTAHNSGYVYISRTPFDGGDPHTRIIDRAKWRTGNPQFIFDPPRAPRVLSVSLSYLSGPVQTTSKPYPRPQLALTEAHGLSCMSCKTNCT